MHNSKNSFNTKRKRYAGRRKIETTNEFKKLFRTLESSFRRAFNLKKPKPLAVGIREEIFNSGIDMSRKSVRKALTFYCRSHQYLRCLKEGAQRVGLDGKPTGDVVTKEEADAAYAQCSDLFKRNAEAQKKKKKH